MNIINLFLRYCDIVWYRTKAQLKAETNNNYLGYAWLIIEPLITTAILYLVFGVISGDRSTNMVLYILVGMMVWQWFEGSVMIGSGGVSEKLHLMNHVKLPKFLFPLVGVLANTWKCLCVFVVLMLFCNLVGAFATPAYLLLPIVFVAQLFFIVSLALPLSICAAYLPDLMNVVSSLFRLLFFLSGIFFTREQVPEKLQYYFDLNPIAHFMTAFRSILIDGVSPSWNHIGYCVLFASVPFFGGLCLFYVVDKKIVKAVTH